MEQKVDIKENYIYELDNKLLEILLKDHSSNKNIIWATDNYAFRGKGYYPYDYIALKSITGRNGLVIKPRVKKSKKEQSKRIKDKAEVFTPSWICNAQNNLVDEAWFGRKNVFNVENQEQKTWQDVKEKISFPKDKTWQDYVELKVLEISCGEAPYLVSRYDTVSGEWLEVNNRIGALDRKIRVVNENVDNEKDWHDWVIEAYKSTFGFEWQGDSLLIARENLLFTFIDYYVERFENYPIKEYLEEIAKILSWNIWQMDGLKFVIPDSCKPIPKLQMTFFNEEEPQECPGCKKDNNSQHTGIYCKVMNWETKRSIKFYKGEKKMKFDFVIGNPPYQVSDKGNNNENSVERTSAISVYPYFVTESKRIGDVVSLIIPSRWMTGGKGLDKFRQENLLDTHYKTIHDYENDKELFPNTDIGGGVMYYLWDKNYSGMLDYYHHDKNTISKTRRFLNTGNGIIIRDYISSIIVGKINYENSFMNLVSPRNSFKLNASFIKDIKNYSDTKNKIFNIKLYTWDIKPIIKYISEDNFSDKSLLMNYKVFISKTADPPIRFGRENKIILRKPFLGEPFEACSETYLTIGNFKNEIEPKNIIKYIQTKFFRFLVLQKKKTQNVSRGVFEFVPLQDFTHNSDIDWTKPIEEIDKQLYKKYNLTDDEINFIETHVEEMK